VQHIGTKFVHLTCMEVYELVWKIDVIVYVQDHGTYQISFYVPAKFITENSQEWVNIFVRYIIWKISSLLILGQIVQKNPKPLYFPYILTPTNVNGW
jgi:hypothetical protein